MAGPKNHAGEPLAPLRQPLDPLGAQVLAQYLLNFLWRLTAGTAMLKMGKATYYEIWVAT